MSYYRPASLDQSLELLAAHELTVVAGATDLYPACTTRSAWGDWRRSDLLDISALEELRGIRDDGDCFRIGALTTWTDLVAAPLPGYFDTLKQAARNVGGVQIQNRATLVGNICNASPAADGVPGLLCLNTEVELSSRTSKRILPLDRFILGNRKTAIQPGEMVTALLIPKLPETAISGFEKLGARSYLVISIVMVAGMLDLDTSGRIRQARISIGACSPVARRMTRLEQALEGRQCEPGLEKLLLESHLETLQPIDDVRSDAHYRRSAAMELSRRLLASLSNAGVNV